MYMTIEEELHMLICVDSNFTDKQYVKYIVIIIIINILNSVHILYDKKVVVILGTPE